MRRNLVVGALAAGLIWLAAMPAPSVAQTPAPEGAPQPLVPPSAAQPSTAAGGPRVVSGRPAGAPVRVLQSRKAGEVRVALNKSQVIELDQPYAEVSVGNPEVADVVPLSTRSVYVFGRKLGTTNVALTADGGRVIAVVDIVVSHDLDTLREQLAQLMPSEPIEVRPASDGLVLSGTVSSPDRLAQALAVAARYAPEKVTNLLHVAGSQQVMLAVRFAEVQRSAVRELGVTNIVNYSTDGFHLNAQTGNGPSFNPLSYAAMAFGFTPGNFQLNSIIDALEEKGVVKVLAEPNLVALSGGTARFLAGGEFPVPVAQDNNTITVEFKEFGVSLAFTPTVLTKDLVNLELATEVSAIDPNNSVRIDLIEVPGLRTRRAKTTVELKNGQSFAIAGLLSDDFRDQARQFPFLGDIPILGTLFRSSYYRKEQTELVVIVTPYLVQPQPVANLKLPTDTFVPPTSTDLFLFGHIEGVQARWRQAGAGPGGGLSGSYGYILQ